MIDTKKAAPIGNGTTRHKGTEKNHLKELPVKFTGSGPYTGFEFAQISAIKSAYCYEVNVNGVKYYHVFKRVENHFYCTISYPRPEAFGRWAWSFRSLAPAMHKLKSLCYEKAI